MTPLPGVGGALFPSHFLSQLVQSHSSDLDASRRGFAAWWQRIDAVCGPADWVMWGTPNCGKGQPGQSAHTGHVAAPARFRNVRVGVMR